MDRLDIGMPIIDLHVMSRRTPVEFSQQVDRASYYFVPPARDRVSVVCGGFEACRRDYEVSRRDFRYHSVEFVASGRGEVTLRGRRHPLGPGMLFGYGPGIPHCIRTDAQAPMTKYFVDFSGPGARAFIRSTPFASAPAQVSDPLRIREILDDMQRTALAGAPLAGEICALQLRLLGLRARELAIAGGAVHDRAIETYLRCREEIVKHAGEWSSLGQIAKGCRLDPAYLCRVFKRFGNVTPRDFLERQRMNRAADLLQRPVALIKEVADALGYSDPFHFSRAFKRVHGLSPRNFLDACRRE